MATATASKAPAAATEAGKTTAAVRQRRVRFQCGAETETDVEKLVDAGGLEALHNQGGRGHAPPYPPLQVAAAARNYAPGTVTGAISALADWQRSRGALVEGLAQRAGGSHADDVRVLESGDAELSIRKGKSDQRGVGAVVYLAGMTSSGVPVGRIVERHLSLAKEQGATNGQPLFTPGARRGRGVGMGKGKISVELRVLLKGLQADVPGVAVDLRRVASHSLRRGGTTAAANAGVEEIKEHGRVRAAGGGRGVGMGKGKISVELRVLLKGLQADVPGVAVDLRRVASHSLRRGGTTAAANAGVEEIKEHGRWRSSAVLVYVQRAVAVKRTVVARM
ncbi:protein ubiquitination [Pleodorina starrii]|nr:protein ubiquitination [Pleodorina starrii]